MDAPSFTTKSWAFLSQLGQVKSSKERRHGGSSKSPQGLRGDAPPCNRVGRNRAAVVVLHPHDGRGNFEGALHCKYKVFMTRGF